MSEIVTTVESKYPEGVKYSPVAFAIVALVSLFFLYQFVGGGITLLLIGGNITRENVQTARIATMAAQFIFLLIPTLILVKMQHRVFSNALKWRIPSVNEIVLSFLGMIALLQTAEGYIYFQEMIPIPESIAPFIDMLKKMIEEMYRRLVVAQSIPELLFVLVVVSLTPAICEEILFRGLIQKNFSLGSNKVRGVIVTGIIFGLYHFNPFAAIPLIALGIYFSFLQYRSQTLIVPMFAHFVNNTLSSIVAYVYGFDNAGTVSLLKSENMDVSSTTVFGTTLLFALMFIIIMKLYVRTTDNVAGREV